jgi:hypothetical protein
VTAAGWPAGLAFGAAKGVAVDDDYVGVGAEGYGRVARGATGPAGRARGGDALGAVAVRAVHAGVFLAHALPVPVFAAAAALTSAAGAGAYVGVDRGPGLGLGLGTRLGAGMALAFVLVGDCCGGGEQVLVCFQGTRDLPSTEETGLMGSYLPS